MAEPDVMSAIVAALVTGNDVVPVFAVQDGPHMKVQPGNRDVVYLRHPTGAVYRVEVSRHA